ncbi:hypothetical protein GCM10018781_43150 [Kitasatospora indigofera]|uniref:Uncharacterized protein n=1 Tax=Kitasatospora indigofera TaxID=67307 RepID=A0A919FYV4_9ACTN|nr:hypothetical protein GCM10018781_43150 [Kitasatospora indigofera]
MAATENRTPRRPTGFTGSAAGPGKDLPARSPPAGRRNAEAARPDLVGPAGPLASAGDAGERGAGQALAV